MNDSDYIVDREGETCIIDGCLAEVTLGTTWLDGWSTDEDDDLYCIDHNYLNPTSDDYNADAWLDNTTRI